jgi:hypothetical protein
MTSNIIRSFINDSPIFILGNILLLCIVVGYMDYITCNIVVLVVYLFPLNLAAKLDRELACLLLTSLCVIELISVTY